MDFEDTLDFENLSISELGPITAPSWYADDSGGLLAKVNLQLRATKDVINRCNWLRNMIEEELRSWTEDSLNMREDLERRLRLVEQREIAQFLKLGCACYELWGSLRPPDEMEREMYTQQMMDAWLRNELEIQFRDYLQTTRKVRTFVHWIY